MPKIVNQAVCRKTNKRLKMELVDEIEALKAAGLTPKEALDGALEARRIKAQTGIPILLPVPYFVHIYINLYVCQCHILFQL
jgi:hypothetical protein